MALHDDWLGPVDYLVVPRTLDELAEVICREAGKPIKTAMGEAARCLAMLERDLDTAEALATEAELRVLGAIEEDHIGPHVGQQHAAEGTRADALEFEHADAGERATGVHGRTPVTTLSAMGQGDMAITRREGGRL